MKVSSTSLLVVGLVACGGSDLSSEPDGSARDGEVSAEAPVANESSAAPSSGEAGSMQRLAVSSAGAALGLDHWEFDAKSIYGFGGGGEVLAEFHVRADNLAIESIAPEQSVRNIDGSAEFSPLTKGYYDALARDLQFLSASGDPADLPADVEKAVVNCFLILDNCLAEAAQRLVLFGQSCTCSLNVAACGVFLPLALDCI